MSKKMTDLHLNRILIVDDFSANLQLLTHLLTEQGYTVYPASNGELALRFVQLTPPDLILLDIKMPEMDGFEVCHRLKADKRTSSIPVIFISALGSQHDKVKAFQAGGVDYITKPIQSEEVLARVQTHINISGLQKKLEKRAVELTRSNQQLEQEIEARKLVEKRLKILSEELKRSNKELEDLVLIDALTKLHNRRGFFTLTEQQLIQARRTKRKILLVYADLNGLKKINDTFGHQEGDLAIIAAAKILKKTFRTSDIVARIGGDEFVVLAMEASKDNQETLKMRLYQNQAEYNQRNEQAYEVSLSIGIVEYDPDIHASIDELLKIADALMYENKRARKDE